MAENTLKAPIGRKQRSEGVRPQDGKPVPVLDKSETATKAEPARRSKKNETADAYFPSHAAAKNAEVRKSREMKKALMSDAKHSSSKPAAKSGNSSEKPSKHRKGPPKASSGSRKPKAKS
ncbi:hypothetical protein D3C77_678300 [compost metagenome]